jgi:multidrug efflux system membrane fusion protein
MKNIKAGLKVSGIVLLAFGLLAIITFQQCTSSSAKPPESSEQPGIPVKVAREEVRPMVRPIKVSGTIEANKEHRLSFKTGGIIQSVLVEEGQSVLKGQLLATLRLDEINARVKQAELGVKKASRDFDRINNLYRDSVVTLQRFQDAKTALEIARADLEVARYNLRFSRIVAPANGSVLKKLHETDELVNAGSPIFLMASKEEEWQLRTALTDKEVVHVKPGDKASVRLDAYSENILCGHVSQVGNAPDPGTGLYEVEISLQPNDLELKTGFFADAGIFPDNKKFYLTIPVEAVTEGLQDSVTYYALSADRKKAIRKKGRVEWIEKDLVVLSTGTEKLDSIIVESPRDLRHLADVVVVDSKK